MDKKILEKLRKKGWKKKDIKETIKIIERKKQKSKKMIFLDKIVYWVALFIAIIGNMLIAVSILPFLLTLNEVLLYLIIVIMGLAFGLLFEIIIRDIENLEKKHHIIITILMPSISLIFFFIITIVANNIKKIIGIGTITHEPLIVGTIYAVAFILPYAVYQLILKK